MFNILIFLFRVFFREFLCLILFLWNKMIVSGDIIELKILVFGLRKKFKLEMDFILIFNM